MVKNLYLTSLNSRAAYYYRHGLQSESQATAKVAEEIAAKLESVPLSAK
jgi:hypothetical protein